MVRLDSFDDSDWSEVTVINGYAMFMGYLMMGGLQCSFSGYGVSLWRLIEHDFGNADGAPNLKPALRVLYSLAVAQGLLFGYKQLHALGGKVGLAEFVADQFTGSVDKEQVSAYLEDTVAGCEKDPSFANRKNLVTYAVDLIMEARSNDGFIAGIKILGAVTTFNGGRKLLAKHLLTKSASSSHMIQRLLETLGPRSPYSSEIREKAACLVSFVAPSIHLEQYPVWIECISSLIDTFEDYSWVPEDYRRDHRLPKEYERDWLLEEYERDWLLFQPSTSVYSTTSAEGAGNIMAPLISKKQLHKDHHDVWSDIAGESMELMMRLMATPGNTGTKMRSEILLNSEEEIASTLESILECLECEVRLKRLAIETLLNLSLDTSSVTAGGSSARRFTWILLVVLILRQDQCPSTHVLRKNSDIRRLAREKLLAMLSLIEEPSAMLPLQQNDDEGNSTHMLQAVRFVLGDLTRAFLDAGNISDRVRAVKILWYLVEYYTKDDGYLKELKKAVAIVMPEVLKLLLGYISPLEDIDIESGGAMAQAVAVGASALSSDFLFMVTSNLMSCASMLAGPAFFDDSSP
ncbi:hypothetical protein PR202_gb23531 [Eleusine coracana subsp. coracana]|uniref:Uncharacterized protein n=1 Tax=Eleusine coracana subsp. coracana TaxID=191504 RepID=A0AAV5FIP7_ELECO|nr:hypothetical protein PR202_gb23531 [Eleusine coracana subsp. coracana]